MILMKPEEREFYRTNRNVQPFRMISQDPQVVVPMTELESLTAGILFHGAESVEQLPNSEIDHPIPRRIR